MGKGSNRRNFNEAAYAENYDSIFNKDSKEEQRGNFWDAQTKRFYKWSEIQALRETRIVPEESPEDRFERHMKPIRELQRKSKVSVPTATCFNYEDEQ